MNSQTLKSVLAVLVVFLFAGALVGYFITTQQQAQTAQKQLSDEVSAKLSNDIGALNPILTVKVYDSSGHLYATRVEKHDLLTNIFINWLALMISNSNPNSGNLASFSATSISGTSYTLHATNAAGNSCGSNGWCGILDNSPHIFGGLIEVGTGTVAPARTDTALSAPYQAPPVPVSSSTYDPNTGNVTIAGNIVAQTAVTISESGLIVQWVALSGTTNSIQSFLIAHDVFTGIAVSAGSTIAVQYTIELLNTGFTNNFGAYLSGIFAYVNVAGQSSSSVSGTTTSNGAAPMYTYSTGSYFGLVDSTTSPFITVGTGTATTSRSAYALQTPSSTCTSSIGAVATIFNVNQIKITTSLSCTATQTISEAAFTVQSGAGTSPPNYYFMFWRTTFTGVSVPANTALTITFVITVN
jgi:hypothetical protein